MTPLVLGAVMALLQALPNFEEFAVLVRKAFAGDVLGEDEVAALWQAAIAAHRRVQGP